MGKPVFLCDGFLRSCRRQTEISSVLLTQVKCGIRLQVRLRGLCYFRAFHPFPPHEGDLRPLQARDEQQQSGSGLGEPASQ